MLLEVAGDRELDRHAHAGVLRVGPLPAVQRSGVVEANALVAGHERERVGRRLEAWLDDQKILGRPADVIQAPDGALLVADDQAGAVYRISYQK